MGIAGCEGREEGEADVGRTLLIWSLEKQSSISVTFFEGAAPATRRPR